MGARLKYDLVLERQKAEEALRASEVRYRRLFETAQDGILILDGHSGLITDVNPFLVNLLDYSREEFIGKTLWDIGPFRNIEASKAAFQKLQEKEYIRYENLPLEAKGGRRVNVEFVSNVYGVNGTRVIQCNIRDITARKHAEKQVGEQVQQSQRMEAVGQLAGGLAHDFNNLLGVILGYCELLEHRLTPAGSNRRMVEQIHSAGTRAASLTRQLLAFSRRQVLRPLVLDLNRLVSGMETMLRRLIGENIEIATRLIPDLRGFKADPSQIEHILMNLVVNARDAMPSGGTITIETANVELDGSREYPEVIPGSYVMLAVTDTGTGLGLSTVYGIVKQSAGYIYAYSEPNRGATFKVYLPYVEGEPELPEKEETLSIRGGRETILLVEDDALLRELIREMLEGFGYAVLDSGHPQEAIRTAERHQGSIALLITDVIMPEINGRVLAQKLTTVRPEMKVLYTSGYTGDVCVEKGELEPGCPLLDKPFTRDALAKRIRALLDSPRS